MRWSLLVSVLMLSGAARALPHKGSIELRLTPPNLAGFGQGVGYFDVSCRQCTHSDSVATFTVLGGAGYFLSDRFELGGSLDVLYGRYKSGNYSISGIGFGAGPFGRALFWLSPRLALAPELQLLFRRFSGGDESGTSALTGLQAVATIPLEVFLSDSWSLRLGPGYELVWLRGDGDVQITIQGVVMSWSIATYF